MKLLVYILSIYILVLAAVPCIDVHHDNNVNATELLQDKGHNNPNELDYCSPFCTCSCCVSILIFVINSIILPSFFLFYKRNYLKSRTLSYIYSVLSSIWQPPKLV